MISLLRHTTTRLGSRLGIFALLRHLLSSRGSHVLVFHGVCSRRRPELPSGVEPSFSADEFETTLNWLSTRFRFLDPKQFLEGATPGVLLTFDDGFANNARVALPILERFGAPAVFFITLQHVLDPRDWLPATKRQCARGWQSPSCVPEEIAADLFDGMSVAELRSVASHRLVTIGSHTLSHPFLTRLSDDEVRAELAESRARLEALTETTVDLLAYPTGDYDRRTAEAASEAGYRAAFAENTRSVGVPKMEIPRIGLYSSDSAYLAAKLSGSIERRFVGRSSEKRLDDATRDPLDRSPRLRRNREATLPVAEAPRLGHPAREIRSMTLSSIGSWSSIRVRTLSTIEIWRRWASRSFRCPRAPLPDVSWR